jgi:hypothetical protein
LQAILEGAEVVVELLRKKNWAIASEPVPTLIANQQLE